MCGCASAHSRNAGAEAHDIDGTALSVVDAISELAVVVATQHFKPDAAVIAQA
jgi:hypothetical protein